MAKLKNPDSKPLTGELRVSFFRPFYGDYRIIELAPDYSYAVITGSDMDSLWILSRKNTMPQEQPAAILERLKKLGFDTAEPEYPKQ